MALDPKTAAEHLLLKAKGTGQEDMHYRAYLRAVKSGSSTAHLRNHCSCRNLPPPGFVTVRRGVFFVFVVDTVDRLV